MKGQQLHWVNEINYLGVHVVKLRAKSFKCDVRDAKRFFYRTRTTNEIFGKIGRSKASQKVTLQLIQSKYMPVLMLAH